MNSSTFNWSRLKSPVRASFWLVALLCVASAWTISTAAAQEIEADPAAGSDYFHACEGSLAAPANRWWFTPTDIGGYQAAPHSFQYADSQLRLWGLGRGMVYTDGRYEFSGQETSLTAEGQFLADWTRQADGWWAGLTW
jgi:hypothetical protein